LLSPFCGRLGIFLRSLLEVATIEVTIWGGLAVAGTLTTPLLKGPC